MKRLIPLALIVSSLSACVPLVVGGTMVGGAMVATDRRTAGIQLEDQTIEVKTALKMKELSERTHISVNSYNRVVLLTGEVKEEADKLRAQQIAAQVENVSRVVNELQVGFISSLTQRSNDLVLAAKIKATLIDARELQSNAFYVVVERGEVYLMGRVTEREAHRSAELIRGIPGVQKVVRVFDILSEDELARLVPPKN